MQHIECAQVMLGIALKYFPPNFMLCISGELIVFLSIYCKATDKKLSKKLLLFFDLLKGIFNQRRCDQRTVIQ